MKLPSRSRQINYVNFNQDASCISVGTKKGFYVRDTIERDGNNERFQQGMYY